MEKGREAQAKSMVVLKNEKLLPLQEGSKIYVEGMSDLDALNEFGEVVKDIKEADVVVKRIDTPWSDPKGNKILMDAYLNW